MRADTCNDRAAHDTRSYLTGTPSLLSSGNQCLRVTARTHTRLSCCATHSFGAPCRHASAGFIRVGGTLALLFGAYYLGAAHGEATGRGLVSFYVATIIGRLVLAAAFAVFVARREVEAPLLLLAGANLIGAGSMWLAVRRDSAAGRPEPP